MKKEGCTLRATATHGDVSASNERHATPAPNTAETPPQDVPESCPELEVLEAATRPTVIDQITSEEERESAEAERAKRILEGLGFCGHYMHFHGGGRSGQVPILCMLDRSGGKLSQLELGSRLELKPGSLSEILSKMEAAGVIERIRDTKDRRQLLVSITEQGAAIAQREHERRREFRLKAFTALTDAEQDQLADMLQKIRTTWEELDE